MSLSSFIDSPWVEVGKVLPNGPVFPVPGGVSGYWAPDITKINDTYVLSYTICEKGALNYRLGIATSKTMEPGSWDDRGLVHESVGSDPKGFFAIDSQVIEVGDKVYMNYGSYIDVRILPLSSCGIRGPWISKCRDGSRGDRRGSLTPGSTGHLSNHARPKLEEDRDDTRITPRRQE